MRVYLSVPVIANRNIELARKIASIIENSGHTITSSWVLGEGEMTHEVDVFKRDTETLRSSDAIVAEVSRPSTGVGMEVMLAYLSGKKIILLAQKGSVISRMLKYMDKKVMIEYSNYSELEEKLSKELNK